MIGKILRKKYKIIEELGSGGMAKVYKAISLKSGNFYAVKVLRAEFIKNSEFVERFNIEFENAKVLKHQNIVAVRYSGQEDDIKYIIMDYIDGITLKDYMQKNGVIEYKVAIKIAMDVCSALEYAHSKDIIHRDIKPQNILITRDNIVKVMDFGISKALTSGTITMHGSTMGSVQYFSPEQARGSYAGASSDLYSLGVTLYEMVTGVLPFQGKAPIDIALKHLREKPIEPKMRNSKIPEGLNILILKAMK